jgi:hypothetical protein
VKLPAIPRILLRRWYITLPGLIVVAALSVLVAGKVPPKYQANSYVLLLPPASSVGPGGNQFLALGGLEATTDVLARAMSDVATVNALKAEGVGPSDYLVARDQTTAGPVLVVTTTDKTGAQALADNALVVVRLAPTLAQLQQSVNVNPIDQVTAKRINEARDATIQLKSQLRALLVVIALGLILVIVTASLVDGPLTARAQRRRIRLDSAVESDIEQSGSDTDVVDLTASTLDADVAPARGAVVGNKIVDGTANEKLAERDAAATAAVATTPSDDAVSDSIDDAASTESVQETSEDGAETIVDNAEPKKDQPAEVTVPDIADETAADETAADEDEPSAINGAPINGGETNGADPDGSGSDVSGGSSLRRRLVRGSLGG